MNINDDNDKIIKVDIYIIMIIIGLQWRIRREDKRAKVLFQQPSVARKHQSIWKITIGHEHELSILIVIAAVDEYRPTGTGSKNVGLGRRRLKHFNFIFIILHKDY